MTVPRHVARRDPALTARVVRRTPLLYSAGADAAEDRPAHVRAGSAVTWLGGRLAVVQDDASFVALVDPATLEVDAVALPRGPGGLRQFGDDRGNKAQKLDLEACVSAVIDGAPSIVAFGSGSTAARENAVVVSLPGTLPVAGGGVGTGSAGVEAAVRVVPLPGLYAALRDAKDFSGSELNVEGAVLGDDALWLFQRGNGSPRDGLEPVNAVGAIPREAILPLLSARLAPGGAGGAFGPPTHVTTWDLGAVDGVPLTFTDATRLDSGVLYLATAEDSPDAVRDGPVAGTAVGVMAGGDARCTLLVDERGAPLREKAEGIVLDPASPRRAWIVLDADDAARPSDLCEVELAGPWG